MFLDEKMLRALAVYLRRQHEKNKATNIGWNIGSWATQAPFAFDYGRYNQQNYDSMWQMNIDLRDEMNAHWATIESDFQKLTDFATWIVKDWGGIKKNKPDTLEKYTAETNAPWLLMTKKGGASYSKILSAKNRRRYSILDDRVAVSLNVLQLYYPGSFRLYFDVKNGQNDAIKKFKKIYKRTIFERAGFECNNKSTYKDYNSMIEVMAGRLGLQSIEVEMMLFDNAENLISSYSAIDVALAENDRYYGRRLKRKKHMATSRLRAEGYRIK